ncbi:MAG: HAD-IA family hydrolase [Pseudomonadota bacterium]
MNAVLFDLDGTLADTAPDLANALNQVLLENNHKTLPFEQIRPVVSHGGIALIRLGFNIEPEHPKFETLRIRLLEIYKQDICQQTRLFPGLDKLLIQLEKHNIPWGIVTNKPDWLTEPLLEQLNLTKRMSSLVCGNTLSEKKPHPAPLLHACKEINIAPEHCIYIGDAARDIEAGKRAGMKTIAAAFGYIETFDPPENWQADRLVNDSENLWIVLKPMLNLKK